MVASGVVRPAAVGGASVRFLAVLWAVHVVSSLAFYTSVLTLSQPHAPARADSADPSCERGDDSPR